MDAKRFILIVGSFAVVYIIMSIVFKIDKTRVRERDDLGSDMFIIPPTRETQTTLPSVTLSTYQYNLSLPPESYAIRRALETGEQTTPPRRATLRKATHVNKQVENAVRRFPTTLIIGVRKAGTRALLAMLNIHPQVKSCGPEVHFFDQHYLRGLSWYLEQTPRSTKRQQTIEKTPSYFVVHGVPERIRAYSKAINKTLKFLVIFRDPTVRAVSDYVQISLGVMEKYNTKMKPFEDVLLKNKTLSLINTEWGVVKTGVYSKHLERWLKIFPISWFHFVSGEELVSKPYNEIKKVEHFLGLKPFFRKENFVFNPEKGFPCFRGMSSRSSLRCLGKSKGRSHPHVDERILGELRRYYRPFNEILYNRTNRNFHWP